MTDLTIAHASAQVIAARAIPAAIKAFFDDATNTVSYVVHDPATKRAAIIDSVLDFDPAAGRTSFASADKIIDFVKEHELSIDWLLETHALADHLSAAPYLKEKLGGKIAISKHILDIISTWVPIFQTAADTPADGSDFDYLFDNDEEFTIADLKARMIHTPGHTPADTTYIIEDTVFVGDTIFLPDVGSGRCDFPNGSAEDSYDSSRKLFALPDDLRIYVGHDYPPEGARGPLCMTTVAEQKTGNVRLNQQVGKADFVAKRRADDTGKAVPPLILPSLQTNMRTGKFGKAVNGMQYVKLPLNRM